jgi:hypothetical protein
MMDNPATGCAGRGLAGIKKRGKEPETAFPIFEAHRALL